MGSGLISNGRGWVLGIKCLGAGAGWRLAFDGPDRSAGGWRAEIRPTREEAYGFRVVIRGWMSSCVFPFAVFINLFIIFVQS